MASNTSIPRILKGHKARAALAASGMALALLIGPALAAQVEKRADEDRLTFGASAASCARAACLHLLHAPTVTDDE